MEARGASGVQLEKEATPHGKSRGVSSSSPSMALRELFSSGDYIQVTDLSTGRSWTCDPAAYSTRDEPDSGWLTAVGGAPHAAGTFQVLSATGSRAMTQAGARLASAAWIPKLLTCRPSSQCLRANGALKPESVTQCLWEMVPVQRGSGQPAQWPETADRCESKELTGQDSSVAPYCVDANGALMPLAQHVSI